MTAVKTPIVWAGVVACSSLVGCGGKSAAPPPEPVDRAQAQADRTARASLRAGDIKTAALLYRQALDRALVRDAGEDIADVSFNLAVVSARLRRYDEALAALAQGDAAAAGAPQPSRHLLRAQVLLEMDRLDEAAAAVDASGDAGPVATALRGLIAVERGDTASAEAALASLPAEGPPRVLADRARLAGGIAERRGDPAAAAAGYDREVEHRRAAKTYAAMAEALTRSAAAWAQAGNVDAAAARYLRAGRSAARQPAELPADAWLAEAERLATDETVLEVIRSERGRIAR